MTIRTSDRDEWIAMRAAALFEEYKGHPGKIAEAREWVSGTFDEPFYPDVEAALDRLHDTDADALLASDVLTDLNRLTAIFRAARDECLRDMAEEDAAAEWKQLGYGAAESQAWDMEDAA